MGATTMDSFVERMIGAAALRPETYERVEADRGATLQAMLVVVLASVAAGIGTPPGDGPALGFIGGALSALVGWAAWAYLTYIIGTRLLPAPTTRADVGELLRTTGFAQAPGILRALGAVPGTTLLVWTTVSIWMLVAMVIAVRQALDYDSTWRALAVCINGWILALAIALVIGLLMGPAVSAP